MISEDLASIREALEGVCGALSPPKVAYVAPVNEGVGIVALDGSVALAVRPYGSDAWGVAIGHDGAWGPLTASEAVDWLGSDDGILSAAAGLVDVGALCWMAHAEGGRVMPPMTLWTPTPEEAVRLAADWWAKERAGGRRLPRGIECLAGVAAVDDDGGPGDVVLVIQDMAHARAPARSEITTRRRLTAIAHSVGLYLSRESAALGLEAGDEVEITLKRVD